ncbi:gamma carbonic anhydrase family protein [Acidovorax sp. JHL-9]|uniref:gamma carbonic anhydrase family protein n=1 Tax=Acidovorax sp. JHL-9 TaxID=1276756 RepID=UPI00040863C7|nr:gamma carbonic anhydrase family protein [Acidovorax sp. JHL-9]
MTIYALGELTPVVDASAYVAESATLIGQVHLGKDCSVWPQAVMRADNESIFVAEGSNIQEGAVLHTDPGFPLHIAANVSVGHQAALHGCTVGEGSLIGIQAIVLNGAVIGKSCLVAAGAVVTERKSFPDGSLIVGAPAKAIRQLSAEDIEKLMGNAREYVERSRQYLAGLKPIG